MFRLLRLCAEKVVVGHHILSNPRTKNAILYILVVFISYFIIESESKLRLCDDFQVCHPQETTLSSRHWHGRPCPSALPSGRHHARTTSLRTPQPTHGALLDARWMLTARKGSTATSRRNNAGAQPRHAHRHPSVLCLPPSSTDRT